MVSRLARKANTRERLAGIDLVMFLMLTGCRLNEAASLNWEQVNLDDGSIFLAHDISPGKGLVANRASALCHGR